MTGRGNGKRTNRCRACGNPWSIFPQLHAGKCPAALGLAGVGGRTRAWATTRYRVKVGATPESEADERTRKLERRRELAGHAQRERAGLQAESFEARNRRMRDLLADIECEVRRGD